jgi:hypothetical protein
VVAAGGLMALIFFPFLPRLVGRFGAQKLALVFALVRRVPGWENDESLRSLIAKL